MAEKTNYAAFISSLKSPLPLYLIADQEPYFREKAAEALKKTVVGDDDLNYFLLEGESLSPEELSAHLDSPPIFAEKKLVHIRHFKPSRLNEDDGSLFQKILEDIPD